MSFGYSANYLVKVFGHLKLFVGGIIKDVLHILTFRKLFRQFVSISMLPKDWSTTCPTKFRTLNNVKKLGFKILSNHVLMNIPKWVSFL